MLPLLPKSKVVSNGLFKLETTLRDLLYKEFFTSNFQIVERYFTAPEDFSLIDASIVIVSNLVLKLESNNPLCVWTCTPNISINQVKFFE